MTQLPIPTGPLTVLYERDDAALIGSAYLDDDVTDHLHISLGARDEVEVLALLKTLTGASGLQFDKDDWFPPLR